jgi:hypothetical protein
MTRAERTQAKIAAIELALTQPNIPADTAYYHQELERLKTVLQSLETPQTPPSKTATEFVDEYDSMGDVLRNYLQQAADPKTPEAARVMLEDAIGHMRHYMDETTTEFTAFYPLEPWAIETNPARLGIRDGLYTLKRRENCLLQLLELHRLSLERNPNPISDKLLEEHQNELEALRQRQAELKNELLA